MANKTSFPDPNSLVQDLPDPNSLIDTPGGLANINKPIGTSSDFTNPSNMAAASGIDPSKNSNIPVPGPAALGAMAMGLAAAPLTAGASLPAAMVTEGALSGIGAAGGEAFRQLYQHAKNYIQGNPFGTNGAPATSEEAVSSLNKQAEFGFAQGALAPPINKALMGMGKLIFSPRADGIYVGGSQALTDAVTAGKDLGLQQTAAELTQSPDIQFIEKRLRLNPESAMLFKQMDIKNVQAKIVERNRLLEEGSAGASDKIEALGLSIQSDINKAIQKSGLSTAQDVDAIKNKFLNDLGSDETHLQLGTDAKTALAVSTKARLALKDTAYDAVAAAMPVDQARPTTNFIQALQEAKSKIETGSPVLRQESGVQKQIGLIDQLLQENQPQYPPEIQAQIDNAIKSGHVNNPINPGLGQQVIESITGGNPPEVAPRTYAYMNSNQKMLGALARDTFGNSGTDISVGYGKLKDALRMDMEALANSTENDELINMHKLADAAHANYKNFTGSDLVKTLTKTDPQSVVNTIYAPENDQMILDFQKQFPGLANQFKNKAAVELFDAGQKDLTGDLVRSNLSKFGETANTIWSKTDQKMILDAADAIDGRIRIGDEISKNPMLNAAIKAHPTKVVDKLVFPNEIGPLAVAKQTLGQETYDKIGQAFLQKTLIHDANNAFDPTKALAIYNQYGDKVYRQLYGQDGAAELQNFLTIAARNNAEKNVNRVPGTIMQGNKLVNLYLAIKAFGSHPGLTTVGGVGAVFAPRLAAKAYLSPFVTKWLTEGFDTPAVLSAARPVAARLTSAIANYVTQEETQ